MKVLILANYDLGLYKFRKELIEELKKRGSIIYISLPNGGLVPELKKLGCIFIDTPIDRRGINPKTDFCLLRAYQRIINDIDPDLIITYTIKPNIYGGIAARLAKKKYVENITGLGTAFEKNNIIKLMVIGLYKFALKNALVVFFENDSNRNKLTYFGCCKREKTVVLNGAGVNTDVYCYLTYPDNTITRFLFVGRVMKEKGINELFQAMKMLRDEKVNCFLDVVGPFEEDYKELLDKYEAEGWLKYHGFQNDVRPFISACDCFVLPSYHEGMANTILECAASGRPIVTSDIPGCREAILVEESGFLCKARDVLTLYNAMKKIVFLDKETREKMGIKAREHMKNQFSKSIVVSMTIDSIKQKLDEAGEKL